MGYGGVGRVTTFPSGRWIKGNRYAVDPVSGYVLRWGLPQGSTTPRWMVEGGGTIAGPVPAGAIAEGTVIIDGTTIYQIQRGQRVPIGTVTASTLQPPGNLRTTATTITTLALAWNAVTGATKYEVYVNGLLSSVPTTTSLTLTGLLEDTQYRVGVRAGDNAGNFGPVSELLVKTANVNPDPPTINSYSVTSGQATVVWVKGASTDVDRTEVYVDGVLGQLATVSPTVVTKLARGSHTIGLRNIDRQGLASTTVTITVNIP